MFSTIVLTLIQVAESRTFTPPSYFAVPLVGFLLLGAVASLVAAVLGFARAKAFGPAARWFALACACLTIYHIQWLLAAFALIGGDNDLAFGAFGFINLFITLAAMCAIIGFVKMTNPR
jgi:hypothetical protein